MSDLQERRRSLDEFANASAQPNQPSNHLVTRPTTEVADIFAGQPLVPRDEVKIWQQLSMLAAAAGSDWFYRFPVRSRDGRQEWIEGPSIKLATAVARIVRNNSTKIREFDVGDAWVFYAQF